MPRRTLSVLTAAAALLLAPSAALAAGYATDGSNVCLDSTLTVTTAAGAQAGGSTVTAAVVAMGAAGQKISRLHLQLEVQERTATAWVPLVTDLHAATYKRTAGPRIARTWTVREDAAAIDALLNDHVQVRVYAKFSGVCRGESLGPPLLMGLTPSMVPPPVVTYSASGAATSSWRTRRLASAKRIVS